MDDDLGVDFRYSDSWDLDSGNLVRLPRSADLLYLLIKEKHFATIKIRNLKIRKADKISYSKNVVHCQLVIGGEWSH